LGDDQPQRLAIPVELPRRAIADLELRERTGHGTFQIVSLDRSSMSAYLVPLAFLISRGNHAAREF
jgi:hypothetical protein